MLTRRIASGPTCRYIARTAPSRAVAASCGGWAVPSGLSGQAVRYQRREFSLFGGGDATPADGASKTEGKSNDGRWHLWRQDTHGNTECVDSFHTKGDAENRCAELTCHEHKQHFWVAADSAMTESGIDEATRWFSSPAEDPLYKK